MPDEQSPPATAASFAKFFYRPTVTSWNRLEGRPRAENFDRVMRAEVRDALWMLSKQWQMGEFIGDDAGSPILARTHLATTRLNRYRAVGGEVVVLDPEIPAEAAVEHQPIPFSEGKINVALDLRLLMGRQWLKTAAAINSTLVGQYLDAYGLEPPDPTKLADASLTAHRPVWQQFAAVASRAMDGYAFYSYLVADSANTAHGELETTPSDSEQAALAEAAAKFVVWYRRLYHQPHNEENPSWRPEYLEHQFAVSAPLARDEKVFVAQEYAGGHLDWYDLDVSPDPLGFGQIVDDGFDSESGRLEGTVTRTIVPTSVSFAGMPEPRWWTFEDRDIDLGFIKPDMPDLNKLLLAEFVLVYAADWFVAPITLPAGAVSEVQGLMVTDVFGEHTWVEPAGAGPDEQWQRWAMYLNNVAGTDDVPADTGLFLVPAAHKVLDGRPIEEIFALRDEIANMVWGVEERIPTADGRSMAGRDAGRELKAKLLSLLGDDPPADQAPSEAAVRYSLVNSVPEQWIPFVPVHIDDDQREVQLQRSAMPRIIPGASDPPSKIEPRTSLLRVGLDDSSPRGFFLHEEEVPRAGINVRKSFRRTRSYDGKVFTWLGIRKGIGRGGGSSGLAFDQLVPVDHNPPK